MGIILHRKYDQRRFTLWRRKFLYILQQIETFWFNQPLCTLQYKVPPREIAPQSFGALGNAQCKTVLDGSPKFSLGWYYSTTGVFLVLQRPPLYNISCQHLKLGKNVL